MKNYFTKSFFTLCCVLLVNGFLWSQTTDSFGYEWRDSNDPEGPTFEWIDITGVGTEVEGLSDDNAVGPISMGMDFRYYWYDVSEIKIGSNGWLSFDNVSNIASCFPALPTAGGDNNLVCPLMSDLNFANGSAGKMYTYHDETVGDEKFIISYENASHWTQADPIFGSNTFQVIFSQADKSITFQYAEMEADFAYTCTGSGKIGVGMENITGNIGLEVIGGVMPPSNYAIKFYYPEEITISIFDVAPISHQNPENEGVFILPNENITLTATVQNTGNTDINSATEVALSVQDILLSEVADGTTSIPSLALGESAEVSFPNVTVDWEPGAYYYNTTVSNSEDINAGNNMNSSELRVLDVSGETTVLGYFDGQLPTGSIQWAGGGDGNSGGGIEVVPPFYPAVITSVQAGIATGSIDGFTIKILDDDGPNGGPGTELASRPVFAGEYTENALNQFDFEDPITITEGGFYIGWFMDGNTVALLVEANGALANRGYEILAGSWAKYRTAADLYLSAVLENPFFVGTKDIVEDNLLNIFPNPNQGTFQIDNTLGQHVIEHISIINVLGASVYETTQRIGFGEQLELQTDLGTGLYFIEMRTTEAKRIVQKLQIK